MKFDFKKYVMQQRATGRSDKQIATSLGMSLKHFFAKIDEIENKNPIVETFKKQMSETILKPKKNEEPKVVKVEPVVTEEPQEVVEES